MERHLRSLLRNGKFSCVSPTRSNIMASIRGKSNKTTEQALRMALVRAGVRGWRVRATELPGKPDFYFETERIAVFVDGCFWHGCPRCGHIPKTRSRFWDAKFKGNRARDRRNARRLNVIGIRVIHVWEHALKDAEGVARVIKRIDGRLHA